MLAENAAHNDLDPVAVSLSLWHFYFKDFSVSQVEENPKT